MSVTVNYDSLKYTGNWFPFTPGDGSGMTLYGTVATGSTASLTFTGTSVGVYGTIFAHNTNPQSTYSIDGTVLASFTEPSDNYTHYNQLLWQSPTLSNNAHQIVVTYHDGIGFWLDYMQYTTQSASSSPPSTSSPSSTSVNTPTSPTVVNPSPTQTPQQVTTVSSIAQTSDSLSSTQSSLTSSPHANPSTTSQFSVPLSQATSSSQSTPTPGASSSNRNSIGPIVGGVVGGLLLLLLLFLLVCFQLRRKRRSREEIEEHVSRVASPIVQNPGPSSVTPFTAVSPPTLPGAGVDASQYPRQDGFGYKKVGLHNARPSQSDSYGTSMYTRSRGLTGPSQSSQLHLTSSTHDPHNQESTYAYTEAPPEYADTRT